MNQNSQQPVYIMTEGTQKKTGKDAQRNNIHAAKLTAELVRTTLGPKGMDKMMVNHLGDVVISNDGATILTEMKIEHPAAKMMVEIARTQDNEVGDGPQPLYSKVLTPNGFVKMGSLKIGDEICGTNKTIQKVLGIFPKDKKEIHQIKFTDGRKTECCEDHLWSITTKDNAKKTLTTKKMLQNKVFTLDKDENKRHNYYVPVSKAEFIQKELFIDPYLLGVLIGDGSLTDKKCIEISLGLAKEHVIDKIKLPEGLELYTIYDNKKHYFRVKIKGRTKNGKNMIDLLRDINLHGKKSDDKFIPKDYLYSDYKSRLELLQGLTDTDGHTNKRGLLEYSTISKKLYSDVLELLRGLGKVTHSYLKKRKIDSGSYSHKSIYRISELGGYKNGNQIDEIIKTGKYTEMQCIKVSNEDNLYFTDDYILTHNTTTAVVIAGALLAKAEELLDKKIHPTTITKGYYLACEKALEILNDSGMEITIEDKQNLINIAQTAMTGKSAERSTKLPEIAFDAVKKVNNDIENIKTEKKSGGSISDTNIVNGIVIDKEIVHSDMPRQIKDAKILILESALEHKDLSNEAKISINSPDMLKSFQDSEQNTMKEYAEKIKTIGANVVICEKGIDDYMQSLLSQNGVIAVRRVKIEDVEKIAKATKGKKVSDLLSATEKDLGHAGLVEERIISSESMIFIEECDNPKALTILIRGGSEHVIDEIERAFEDAIKGIHSALELGKVVPGGGAVEIMLSKELRKYAESFSGREQLSIISFAEALESIPIALAENAGLDPIDKLAMLRSEHEKSINSGLDVYDGKVKDMFKNGVLEPLKIKIQAIKSASEVSEMILRIDDVVMMAPGLGEAPVNMG